MQIGVAAMTLSVGFQGLIYSLLKKHLHPGDTFVECSMVLEKTPEHVRSRLTALLKGATPPTALICICLRPDPETVAAYRSAGIPIVLIDEEQSGASTVASDNFAGGLLAARHLIVSGRRSLGIVCGRRRIEGGYNAAERMRGFAKGLSDNGLSLGPERVIEVTNYSRKDGIDAMAQLLNRGDPLDAVFCAAGDLCASGMLVAARERGVRIPQEVALLGYDDAPVAVSCDPPLSTLRQPLDRISREAYQLATEEAAAILDRPRKLLLEPQLVARASTPAGPARRT